MAKEVKKKIVKNVSVSKVKKFIKEKTYKLTQEVNRATHTKLYKIYYGDYNIPLGTKENIEELYTLMLLRLNGGFKNNQEHISLSHYRDYMYIKNMILNRKIGLPIKFFDNILEDLKIYLDINEKKKI